MIFACCVLLFTLGNAAMLPLIGNTLTKTAGSEASLLIAACIVLPQLIVALALAGDRPPRRSERAAASSCCSGF